MSIYDQDHNTIQKQLTPPDKRSETMLAWERCLSKPVQWLHDLFFIDYAKGTLALVFNNSTQYAIGDRVIYLHQVFEVWAVPPIGAIPSETNYWIKVVDDFRGADERVRFNSQVTVFEYLLNQWFNTTFKQPVWVAPPGTPNPKSDIWIESKAVVDGSFVIRVDGGAISFIKPKGYNYSFIRPNHTFNFVNLIVHYPIAIIPDASYQLTQLKSLIEQYKLAGTIAGYQSY
jgi:hypothetical protein